MDRAGRSRARCLVVVLVAAIATSSTAGAQRSPRTIHGRVVADDTGDPLRNARVAPDPVGGVEPVLTDADGRFVLTRPAGAMRTLVASKTGFAAVEAVVADEVAIRLPRGAAITGRVLDEFGAPVPLMTVVSQRVLRANGVRTAITFSHVETDESGMYRLFGLPAGEFVVATAGGRVFGGSNTTPIPREIPAVLVNYYPHAQNSNDATVIAVAAGDEAAGINLTVLAPHMPPVMAAKPVVRTGNSSVIRGRVLGSDGLPVRHARVEISSAERLFSPSTTTTDDDGQYEFGELAAGSYYVAATDAQLQTAAFGQRRSGDRGDAITVAAAATFEHADIAMPRTGAISGRIVDEFGDPIANVNVRAEEVRRMGGRLRLIRMKGVAGRQANDLGRFRIFGLPPGRYVVSAVVGELVPGWETADLPGFMHTYFPGTPVATDAQSIEVVEGQDALNVDFALVRGATARLRGRVLTAAGEPFDGNVHVNPSDRSRAIVDSSFPRRVRADHGRFEFDGLAPAEYVVQAATSRLEPPIEGEFGAVFVRIESADVDDVVIGMSRGSTITGQVTFDGPPPPSPEEFELTADSVDPDLASFAGNPVAKAEPRDDWTFEMGGLNGPRRLRLAAAPAGWIVKAVLVNGIDMTDRPLPFGTKNESLGTVEVVVTNRSAEVAGVVTDADSGTAAGANSAGGRQDAIVVAFPVDRARWYPHSGLVVRGDLDRNGAFVVRGVRPGEYYVAAVDARAATERYEGPDAPDFLEWAVAAATRVTLTPDQRATVTLRIAR